MVNSISSSAAYYALLNSGKSGKKQGAGAVSSAPESLLNAISASIDANKAAAKSTLSDSSKLPPEVKSMLEKLSGGNGDVIGNLFGNALSTGDTILEAASRAAMKQAFSSIARAAYQGASAKSAAETTSSAPMDSVIGAYRKAIAGAAQKPKSTSEDA